MHPKLFERIFSRYSGVTSITGDNCILSTEDVARLVNNNDVLVDDNWDLYQRVEGGYNCRGAQTGEHRADDVSCETRVQNVTSWSTACTSTTPPPWSPASPARGPGL